MEAQSRRNQGCIQGGARRHVVIGLANNDVHTPKNYYIECSISHTSSTTPVAVQEYFYHGSFSCTANHQKTLCTAIQHTSVCILGTIAAADICGLSSRELEAMDGKQLGL